MLPDKYKLLPDAAAVLEKAMIEGGVSVRNFFSRFVKKVDAKGNERSIEVTNWNNWKSGRPVPGCAVSQILANAKIEGTVIGEGKWRTYFEKVKQSDPDSEREAEDEKFEQQYLEALIEKQNVVELFTEPGELKKEDRQQALDIAYVSLSLMEGRQEKPSETFVAADYLLERRNAERPHVLIIGLGGNGKTTILRWFAIEAARSQLNDQFPAEERKAERDPRLERKTLSVWRQKIPLFVRLRHWANKKMPEPEQFLANEEDYLPTPQKWVTRVLNKGRGLVLLDGLDEISEEWREQALIKIKLWANEDKKGNLFVVSSRPQAVDHGALHDAGFQEFEVQPLSKVGREQFVNNWHEAVARRRGHNLGNDSELRQAQERMHEALENNVTVRTLASVPLLAALMCALNRRFDDALPKDLPTLCRFACDMLLWWRDKESKLDPDAIPVGYRKLEKADRVDIARRLAYDMVKQSRAILPQSSVLALIRDALDLKSGEDDTRVEQILVGLIERSTLLRRTGKDGIEFVHNYLRDYLAATLFVLNNEVEYLFTRLNEDRSQTAESVLLFAIGTEDNKDFAWKLMKALLQHDGLSGTELTHRQLVTLKADGRMRYRPSERMSRQLEAVKYAIGDIDTVDKAVSLAATGETALDFFRFRSNLDEVEEVACVHGLGLLQSRDAKEELDRYLRPGAPPTILQALAQFYSPKEIANCDNVLRIPSVAAAVRSKNGADKSYVPFIRDLSPLRQLTGLRELSLNNTQVRDLSPLQELDLESLSLNNTSVGDLSPLWKLTRLRQLFIDNVPVTVANIERLRLSVPSLQTLGQILSSEI